MEKQSYITEIEREKCRMVTDAFSELYEAESIVVLDAGKYGFVMLQYYNSRDHDFDDTCTFVDSRDLFERLWDDWLDAQLLSYAKGTPMAEMDYEDIFRCLPKEKQKELTDRRMYFAEKAGLPEYGTETDET